MAGQQMVWNHGGFNQPQMNGTPAPPLPPDAQVIYSYLNILYLFISYLFE